MLLPLLIPLTTKELLYEDKQANSVAWNADLENMFCFSGNNMLSIKTGDFPVHQQKLQVRCSSRVALVRTQPDVRRVAEEWLRPQRPLVVSPGANRG